MCVSPIAIPPCPCNPSSSRLRCAPPPSSPLPSRYRAPNVMTIFASTRTCRERGGTTVKGSESPLSRCVSAFSRGLSAAGSRCDLQVSHAVRTFATRSKASADGVRHSCLFTLRLGGDEGVTAGHAAPLPRDWGCQQLFPLAWWNLRRRLRPTACSNSCRCFTAARAHTGSYFARWLR